MKNTIYIFESISFQLTETTTRESLCRALYRFGRIFGGLEEKVGSLMSELIITTCKQQKLSHNVL